MRSCTGEGLPADPITRTRRALLPHDFALTPPKFSTPVCELIFEEYLRRKFGRGGMFLLHSSPSHSTEALGLVPNIF